MRKNAWMLVACLAAIILLSGCRRSPGYLRPIIGEWTYDSAQKQLWTWGFPDDETVRFSIDNQKQQWSITAIRVRGAIIEIDVDGFLGRGEDESSTINVELLDENNIYVSSGLHPGLPFERVND